MTQPFRRICMALSISAALAGCGGDEQPASATKPIELTGVYRAATDGPIDTIGFSEQRYELVPMGCGTSSCVERGKFWLEDDHKTLVLENEITHATQSLPLRVLETSKTDGALVQKGLATRNLVQGGGQLTQGGSDLVNGGEDLVNGGDALVESGDGLVQPNRVIVGGQELVRA